MTNNYFVLYERNINSEKIKKADGRMLYKKLKKFKTEEKATKFGLSKLQGTPIIAKTIKCLSDYHPTASYIVAAYFPEKYQRGFCGDYYNVPMYEVLRCTQDSLDKFVEELAREGPSKLYLGIEEKFAPTALDRIRSVNHE